MASDYEPASRRPISDVFRKTAHLSVRLCVYCGNHPDAVSYASVVASAGAAVCFWQAGSYPWLLLVAPLVCYVRLWLNMLDGMVALASGKASRRGEILNDLPDRVSDVLIFVGVSHSGLCNPFAAYWAAILALLTAYVGILGQAVGVQREYSGVMSKPWRMVMLHAGAWTTFGILWFRGEPFHWGPLTVLDLTCFVVILGCLQTVAIRLRRILVALSAKPPREAPPKPAPQPLRADHD